MFDHFQQNMVKNNHAKVRHIIILNAPSLSAAVKWDLYRYSLISFYTSVNIFICNFKVNNFKVSDKQWLRILNFKLIHFSKLSQYIILYEVYVTCLESSLPLFTSF